MSQPVDAKDVVETLAKDEKTTNVYAFPADAPPDKKAQAAAAQTSKTAADLEKSSMAGKLVSDVDDPNVDNSIPSGSRTTPSEVIEKAAAFNPPSWVRIGWQRVSGYGEAPETDIFESFLGDLYYGQMWTNAAAIFSSVFTTWLLTKFNFGIGWILILCAFLATYYKKSMGRFYRNARSDINREYIKERLENDAESTDWINEFMRRFWLIFEPVLSATVVQQVDAVLAAQCPGFLDSIRLTTFTLGTKPPMVLSVKSYPKADDDVVVMDWHFTFEPNDVANMTRAQLRKKVNPKIVLTIRVGKGFVGAGIPILLEDMAFTGKMKIRLKLMKNFPHVKTVDVSFLEPPKWDFVLKPIGGETFGFDIANIPGLHPFIRDIVHANLRPMLYDPNYFTVDVEALLGGVAIENAIGVLKLVIYDAKNLTNVETFGISDPFVKITIKNRELARTKVQDDTLNPHWNETHFVVLTSIEDNLMLELFDSNVGADKPLGTARLDCEQLKENPKQKNVVKPVMLNGLESGEIRFDALWYPVAQPDPDGQTPESDVGILRFTLHAAKELDASKSTVGEYNPYGEIYINRHLIHTTKVLKRTNDPQFEEYVDMFITNKNTSKLGVIMKDSRSMAEDPAVGVWQETVAETLRKLGLKQQWFNVTHANSGKVRLSCTWKPVLLDYVPSQGGYKDPIGVVKIKVKSAKDLKNVEGFGGSCHPFVRLFLGNKFRSRTDVVRNTLNPTWKHEYHYIPVHSRREAIVLEAVHDQGSRSHRSLGKCELTVGQLADKGQDGSPVSLGLSELSSPLRLHTEMQGELLYDAVFYPAADFEKLEKKDEQAAPSSKGKDSAASKPVQPINTEDILKHQCGLAVIHINDAKMEKRNIFVECLVDDFVYPFFKSDVVKLPSQGFESVTDTFVKELDFSRLTFNIRQEDRREPIAHAYVQTKDLLRKCHSPDPTQGVVLPLADLEGAQLSVHLKYIPTPEATIESVESINNMGTVSITVKNATDLPAADRAGTSDPYIIFTCNGEQVHRTQTIKKTLNPEYNEKFELSVPSRKDAEFFFEVYDWNQLGPAKMLGRANIDVKDLTPFEGVEQEFKLEEGQGSVWMIVVFRPDFVLKRRLTTGTFSNVGRALTGLGDHAVGGATTVVGTAVKGGAIAGRGVGGVVHGAANVGKVGAGFVGTGVKAVGTGIGSGLGLRKKGSVPVLDAPGAEKEVNTGSTEGLVQPVEQSWEMVGETGSLQLHIIEAKDIIAADFGGTSDPYVRVVWQDKEVHKTAMIKKTLTPQWNEYVTLHDLNGSPAGINLEVYDSNSFTRDVLIGKYVLNVWQHISPGNYTADFWANLTDGGEGKLHLKIEFTPQK